MILQPPKPISSLIANLAINGNTIIAKLPRNEIFRKVIRDLGYHWNYTQWERKIDVRWHGPVLDRFIELAHTLVLTGFIVELPDETPQNRVVTGDYQAECKRWIRMVVSGQYIDWFSLSWGRADDLYTAARRLPGSRYNPPNVVVPTDAYLEILDFAEQHGFRLSERAQQQADAAAKRRASAVMIVPERKPKEQKAVAISAVNGIDPELCDEDDVDNNNETVSAPENSR